MSLLSRRSARRSAAGAATLSAPTTASALSVPAMWAVGAVAAVGLAVTGGGVYAALNAQAGNTTPESVQSGSLSLQMTSDGVGFSQAVANLAPTDTVNRYVTLTNNGTLNGKSLNLAVADSTPTLLTTSASKGLTVKVDSCSIPWTTTNGACGGMVVALVPSGTPLSSISSASPALLISSGAESAGATTNLRVSLTLPDQNETTLNGVAPANSIQGLSSALTWTFGMSQRNGSTTNS